jgi:RHS repeat-associated protein
VAVSSVTGVASVDAGATSSLALKQDGTLLAWGSNADGELGDASSTDRHTAVAVSSLTSQAAVSAGGQHSVALKRDGTLTTWGADTSGQLGNDATLAGSTTPVALSGKASSWVSYTYDADGLRMSRTRAGAATAFAWDVAGGLPLLLSEKTGSAVTAYVYGPGGQILERIDPTDTPTYYHPDQQGSVRLITDASGNVAATYTYDAYGKLTASTGVLVQPFGYGGEYTDQETGYQYLRARYYDPTTGQFLTRDPLVAVTGQAYAYADDDPANNADPTGLDFLGIGHAVSSVAGWAYDNAGTITMVAGAAALIPGVDLVAAPIALAAGAIQTYKDASEGHYLAAALDVIGVGTGGYAIRAAGVRGLADGPEGALEPRVYAAVGGR